MYSVISLRQVVQPYSQAVLVNATFLYRYLSVYHTLFDYDNVFTNTLNLEENANDICLMP